METPILLGDEEDKEKMPLTTTTPVSERPNQPLAVLQSRAFGKKIENVPDYVHRKLFQ